jgi:hypothetical protein
LKKGGTTEVHLGALLDICRKPKLRNTLLDLLGAQEILKLASTCKAARHYSLLGFRPIRALFNKKAEEIDNLRQANEKSLSKLAMNRQL